MLSSSRKLELMEKLSMYTSPLPPMGAPEKGNHLLIQNARRLQSHASKLACMVTSGAVLPEWAEQKLTLAADYVQSICNHLTYGEKKSLMPPSRKIIIIKKMGI